MMQKKLLLRKSISYSANLKRITELKSKKIDVEDFRIERTKYNVRSWSGSTFSVVFIINNLQVRIVDWITYEKAREIVNKMQ